jgi:hypothetical protein
MNYLLKKAGLCSMSWLGGALVLAACGGGATPAEAPAQDAAATPEATSPAEASAVPAEEGTEAAPATKKFDALSQEEKMAVMKTQVIPQMAQAFQSFDAKEFETFRCTTCHGPGANNGDFEMPTKSLPKLDEEEMNEHPEMTKFMIEQVVPKMAAILGEPTYNPETHQGFGCFNCHTKKD